jgi:flagellar biosynthesis/type III secretory pathway protein FliH
VVGSTYYTVEPTVNVTEGRYRIYRNGSYYNTDNRGADMLRQAINEGYRQGFAAGRSDYSGRRRSSWSNNNMYRTGTYGYSSGVDRNQYQYYFQQGFQRGYQDGSNSRYQDGYNGDYQYGYSNGGTLNVLATILNQILNIQNY